MSVFEKEKMYQINILAFQLGTLETEELAASKEAEGNNKVYSINESNREYKTIKIINNTKICFFWKDRLNWYLEWPGKKKRETSNY